MLYGQRYRMRGTHNSFEAGADSVRVKMLRIRSSAAGPILSK